jgi:ribosomal protein L11 methyltransferase
VPPGVDTLERLLADIDDDHPTAIEERDDGVRVFFAHADARQRASIRLTAHDPNVTCTPIDVPDEDWAARSQASLGPITVGRVIVSPPWRARDVAAARDADGRPSLVVLIEPSMGFGTGHHATTRLCLALMQGGPLEGARVLDVGTGSGVLALTAWRLGAREALALDNDADALQSANENIALNGGGLAVTTRLADLASGRAALATMGSFDLVLANLTGAVLQQFATTLARFVGPHGRLIVSGCLSTEEPDVQRAFASAGLAVTAREATDEWVALELTSPTASTRR